MTQPTLSVCMIVKDEEKNLPRALDSVKDLADEVIVVDTGSRDKTVDVARSFGAKVYFFEWCDDFSKARNESLSHATMDYILWLDADDEFERRRSKELKRSLSRYRDCAYHLVVRLVTPGSVEECLQTRVFPNRDEFRFEGRIHEQVFPSLYRSGLKFKTLDISITHHGYKDPQEILGKLTRNKRTLELELAERPKNLFAKVFYARTLVGLKKGKEAEDILVQVIESMDEDEFFRVSNFAKIAYFDLLNILSDQSRIDEMERYVKEYDRRFGADFFSDFVKGTIDLFCERYDSAEKNLTSAERRGFSRSSLPFDIRSVYGRLYAKKAFALAKLGRIKEAKRYAGFALDKGSKDREIGDLLADTFVVLKDASQLSNIIERFDFDRGRKDYLDGMVHLLEGEIEKALPYLEDSIEKGYRKKNSVLSLSLLYKRLGKLDEAIRVLSEFVESYGDEDSILKELSLLYLDKSLFDRASSFWQRIKKKSRLENLAFDALKHSLLSEYEAMLQAIFDLYREVFDGKPFVLEKVLDLNRELSRRGERLASEFLSRSINHFVHSSPF